MTGERLVLIDGSSWIYRAFFALPPLASPQGEPTGAVRGMGAMLRKLLKDYAPARICVIFDPPGKTFRDDIYPEYKATRSATPEELVLQFPWVVEMLEGMGLPILTIAGFEADDVIGTLASQGAAAGYEVLIVTGDKDMAQLVNTRVKLLDTMKKGFDNAAAAIQGPAEVAEKFGVPPERIVDYLSLMGDTSDNVPGVPGVGPKTAAKWIAEYGSLDAIIANAEKIGGKVGEKLRAALPVIPMARQLTTIRCDVPLPVTVEKLVQVPANADKLRPLYQRLGFKSWLDELQGAGATPAPAAAKTVEPAEPAPAPVAEPQRPASAATRAECVVDEAAFEQMLHRLQAADLICVDTETTSIDSNSAHLVGLSFAVEAGHGWYVPVAHDYLGAPPQLKMDWVLARLKPLLEDPLKPKLGQHIKYDLNVLMRHGIHVRGVAHDTMLQSYVLDAAGNRHDMDTLAEKYLGHKTIQFSDVAGKGKGQITFNQVSLDKATEYSAEDADITLRLHHALYPRVCEIDALKRVYETIEMPLVPVLAQIEQAGVRIDGPLLRQISAELGERMGELQTACWREAGGEFNLGSPKQLQVILYDKLQLPVLGKTPKGDPSTGEDVLEELAAQHALPRLILDWRALSKLRSTYAENLPLAINAKTGRVHTSYGQAIAATGRLSSSDPNLQNIPVRNAEGRRIRQAFIADPGNMLLSVDYSQIELRLMAHLSGDEKLVAAFHSGLDVHQATAAEVFGLELASVTGEQRRAAKAINFGLIYGMSAFGLAKQLGIGRGEAADYIERFFARYPGVKQFMDGTREQSRKMGYVETLYGRRLYLPNINSRNAAVRQYAERTAINAPLQGTAADLIKLAMIDLAAYLATEAPDIRMIMQVHDELVFEGPQAHLAEAAPAIAARMCRISPLKVPLVADWGLAANWDAAHSIGGSVKS